MTTPKLERVNVETDSTELYQLLERDGAVVVEQALSEQQLAGLNKDLDQIIAATAPGLRAPTHERMIEFYGHSTVRLDGLPAKSETFVDVMLTPKLREVADHFLLPNCHDYLLNTGQLIQTGPGRGFSLRY